MRLPVPPGRRRLLTSTALRGLRRDLGGAGRCRGTGGEGDAGTRIRRLGAAAWGGSGVSPALPTQRADGRRCCAWRCKKGAWLETHTENRCGSRILTLGRCLFQLTGSAPHFLLRPSHNLEEIFFLILGRWAFLSHPSPTFAARPLSLERPLADRPFVASPS